MGRLHEKAGAVEMKADPFFLGQSGNVGYLGQGVGRVEAPSERRFERDATDVCFHAPGGCLIQRCGDGFGGKDTCDRNKIQTAQLLRTVTGIIVDMTIGLDDDPLAGSRQASQSQVIGHRPGRQENRRFLAE